MPRESAGFPQRVKARLVPAPGALPLGLGGCLLCTELIQQHPGLRSSRGLLGVLFLPRHCKDAKACTSPRRAQTLRDTTGTE